MQELLGEQKVRARGEVSRELIALPAGELAHRSSLACQRVIDSGLVPTSGFVLAYAPLSFDPARPNRAPEADCGRFVAACRAAGLTVCLPRMDWGTRSMTPVSVPDGGPLDEGRLGIHEPNPDRPGCRAVPVADLSLVLVPGLAFDNRCGRLGRGAGFYDRFLERVPPSVPTVGLGLECQVLDEVPAGPHDLSLTAVATERRLIRPAGA